MLSGHFEVLFVSEAGVAIIKTDRSCPQVKWIEMMTKAVLKVLTKTMRTDLLSFHAN